MLFRIHFCQSDIRRRGNDIRRWCTELWPPVETLRLGSSLPVQDQDVEMSCERVMLLLTSSWQWQMTGVWTAALHRTCWTTVSRPPTLTLRHLRSISCQQYVVTGSTPTVAGPFQLLAPESGTLSRILSGTEPSVQTVSDVCLRRICLLDTSALSALEVLDDYCAI